MVGWPNYPSPCRRAGPCFKYISRAPAPTALCFSRVNMPGNSSLFADARCLSLFFFSSFFPFSVYLSSTSSPTIPKNSLISGAALFCSPSARPSGFLFLPYIHSRMFRLSCLHHHGESFGKIFFSPYIYQTADITLSATT